MTPVARRLLKGSLVGLVVIAGSVSALSVSADNDTPQMLDKEIHREQRALEKLKGEIERKRKKMGEAVEERESILRFLQKLDDRLIISRQERYTVNTQLKRKDRELEQITNQMDELNSRIRARRSSIRARLRVQYMQGRLGYLKTLLAAESLAEFQRRFQYLSAISQREFDLIETHKEDVARLEEVKRSRRVARKEMLDLKQLADRKLKDIKSRKREKQRFLARITQQKETYERAVSELERSAARVDSLVKELEQRRRVAHARVAPPRSSVGRVKGALPWPASGKVVSFFGRQKHPNFETYIDRKGIEIRTKEGAEIKAVMPGTVAYADWLKGYGLVLILDHPYGFFSLYAHASKLLTTVDAKVQAGEVIGEAGDTGMTGEPTLYFELRDGADPVDPLRWLAKRR